MGDDIGDVRGVADLDTEAVAVAVCRAPGHSGYGSLATNERLGKHQIRAAALGRMIRTDAFVSAKSVSHIAAR